MADIRADVEILGQRLSLRGEGTVEHMRSLAEYLDGRIRLVRDQGRVHDPIRLSLLAGLHVADELFQARAREEALSRQLEDLCGRLDAALGGVPTDRDPPEGPRRGAEPVERA
jgi:cell division protein ZapA